MASPSFIANAVAINYQGTITVANTWAGADTATTTINGKDLVTTVGTLVTTAQVAASIKEAWEAGTFTDTTASKSPTGGGTTIPEMAEITATVSGSVVTLAGDTAGVPHTVSATEATAGTGTATYAQTVAGTGPWHFDNVDNWDTGSLPVSTDTLIIDRAGNLLYGLDQNAITLAELRLGERHTGYIGLPFRNANGYEEYREDYFKISATLFNCRSRSGRIKLNVGSVANTSNIYSTGATVETGRAALQFLGTSASNVFNLFGGDAAICGNTGEVSTVATVRQTAGTLLIGEGGTITTVDKSGGTLTMYCGCTTITSDSGTTRLSAGAGTFTTINHGSGTLYYDGTGTITTYNAAGGTLDLSGNTAAVTITTLNVSDDFIINDPAGRLVLTNQQNVTNGKLTIIKG